MSYYNDIYKKRINKYGTGYLQRIQGRREEEFERRLAKSVYKVSFNFSNELQDATLERYRQDDTHTLQYLLTRRNLQIPAGTIIEIADEQDSSNITRWMVYWLEDIRASGYNRYIVLKMTHLLQWEDRNGEQRESWAYMFGQENNMIKDELKSRSRSNVLYSENLKLSFFIMPLNPYIQKDVYIEVGQDELKEGYRVTGYDRQSSQGVEYVSVDPVYLFDTSTITTPKEQRTGESWEWLNMRGDK